MALTLVIENRATLPDGGPMDYTIQGKRGIDIGRDQYLDWSLPDPGRVVSSKHCEVRYADGGYWLTDVSTNGTFLNGSTYRMQGPHRLRNGDRFEIGHYIIAVVLDQDEAENAPAVVMPQGSGDPWSGFVSNAPPQTVSSPPPPPDPNALAQPDALDWFVDLPPPDLPPPLPRADETWMRALMEKKAASPVAPVPVSPVMPVHEPVPALPPQDPAASFGDPPQAPQPLPPVMPAQPPAPIPSAEAKPQPTAREEAAPFERMPRQPAAPSPQGEAGAEAFLAALARGAGVPVDVFRQLPAERVAEIVGSMMRATLDDLGAMLQERTRAKGLMRSTNQTTIQAFENNPLKFSANAEEALRRMLVAGNRSYLPAVEAVQQSFADLKSHQMNTYGAMQQALMMVIDDLDPVSIERGTEADGGLGGLMSNRKARLWDAYVTKWKAKTARHDNGFLDVFMLYFSECYDRINNKLR